MLIDSDKNETESAVLREDHFQSCLNFFTPIALDAARLRIDFISSAIFDSRKTTCVLFLIPSVWTIKRVVSVYQVKWKKISLHIIRFKYQIL